MSPLEGGRYLQRANLAATRCPHPVSSVCKQQARVCIVHKANLLIYHPAPLLPPSSFSFLLPPASGGRWWRKVASQLVNWSLSVVNLDKHKDQLVISSVQLGQT